MDLMGVLSSLAPWWKVLVPSSLVLWYGSYRYILDKRYRLPPGPTPLPFIGNLVTFANLAPKYGECLHKIIRHIALSYGNVFTIYLGPLRMICLNEANVIREALVDQSRVFSGRIDNKLPGFETIGDGIVLANDEGWKRNRRLLMRAMRDFGMGKERMVTKVQEEATSLIQQFDIASRQGEPFFPRHVLANAVSNVICSLVFGKRFDDPHDPTFVDLLHRIDKYFELSLETPITFLLPFLSYFYIPRLGKYYAKLNGDITKMIGEAIDEHRRDFDPANLRDFADVFIHAESQEESAMPLDEYGMTDMFIAGTETTSTALSWTILYLAKHQDVQRKCHEAIDSVITSDRLPESADRPKLVYLDAVFHEILRCASIAPCAVFHSNLEQHGKISGYDCPPMSMVIYNVATLHLDSNYWKDPQNFRPDRWIDDNGKLANHSSHFMPFGIGPRICLGESLARTEYYIFLVSILQRFCFHLTTQDVNFDPNSPGIINTCPEYKIIAERR